MIETPIDLSDGDNTLSYSIGYVDRYFETPNAKPLFWCRIIPYRTNDRTIRLSYNDYASAIWGIDRYGINENDGYVVWDKEVSKEELVDFLSENYPGHFEWLLFNPGWL